MSAITELEVQLARQRIEFNDLQLRELRLQLREREILADFYEEWVRWWGFLHRAQEISLDLSLLKGQLILGHPDLYIKGFQP